MKNPHFGPWATDDEPYAASIPPNQLTYDTYAFDTVDAPSDAFTALFQLHPDIRNRILQPFPKIQQALARHLMQNGALTTFARSHHLTIYPAQQPLSRYRAIPLIHATQWLRFLSPFRFVRRIYTPTFEPLREVHRLVIHCRT